MRLWRRDGERGPAFEASSLFGRASMPYRVTLRTGPHLYYFRKLMDCDCLPEADTPMRAVLRLTAALMAQDREALDGLFAANERMESMEPSFRERHPQGLEREAHLDHLASWLRAAGGTGSGREDEPAFWTLRADACDERPFPDAGEGERRRVMTIPGWSLSRWGPLVEGGLEGSGHTTLVLVRGDAASLTERQPRDPQRWYVERWFDGPARDDEIREAVATAATAASPGTPVELGVRRASPLSDSPILLAVSLPDASPARLRLFDVAGREVLDRSLGVIPAGRHTVSLEDVRLAPGVYWLRIHQSRREAGLRLVVLR